MGSQGARNNITAGLVSVNHGAAFGRGGNRGKSSRTKRVGVDWKFSTEHMRAVYVYGRVLADLRG